MQRSIAVGLTVLAVWCGAGLNYAGAQFGTLGQPPARPRPTVSPYVNLGEGGNAFNYYGLVKPETDAYKSIQQLQQGAQLLNPDGSAKGPLQPNQVNALGGLQTGHAVTFFNYGHYYPQNPYAGTAGTANLPPGTGLGGYGVGANVGGLANPNTPVGVGAFFGPNLNTGSMRR